MILMLFKMEEDRYYQTITYFVVI